MIGREETASAITGGDAKRRVRGLRRGNCVEGTPAKTGALLTSSTQIAQLDPDGALLIPPELGVTHTIIEIGVSDFQVADVEELHLYPRAFLISFERVSRPEA